LNNTYSYSPEVYKDGYGIPNVYFYPSWGLYEICVSGRHLLFYLLTK